MKLLLIKLSSLGDVIHTLPAIYDMAQYRPDIRLHWLIEKQFEPLAKLSPFVTKTLPVQIRETKKQKGLYAAISHMRSTAKNIKRQSFPVALDAQGLWKSAYFAKFSNAETYGYDKESARDPFASMLYQHKLYVDKEQHAIWRTRQLFAQALGYYLDPNTPINYGLDRTIFQAQGANLLAQAQISKKFIFGFHGTTWETKLWKRHYWIELAQKLEAINHELVISYGNHDERTEAFEMASLADNIKILPMMNYQSLICALSLASGFISVDTGLGHLASALDIPGVGLYGPTAPNRVGLLGKNQVSLTGYKQKPRYNKQFIKDYDAMANITPNQVFTALISQLK